MLKLKLKFYSIGLFLIVSLTPQISNAMTCHKTDIFKGKVIEIRFESCDCASDPGPKKLYCRPRVTNDCESVVILNTSFFKKTKSGRILNHLEVSAAQDDNGNCRSSFSISNFDYNEAICEEDSF